MPSLLETLNTWVSTAIACFPKALPRITLAVFLPTPGSVVSSSMVDGTLPLNSFYKFPAAAYDHLSLVFIKSCRPYLLLKSIQVSAGIIFTFFVFLEKRLRNFVHPHVSALRRENGCNEEFKGFEKLRAIPGSGYFFSKRAVIFLASGILSIVSVFSVCVSVKNRH